MVVFEGFRFLIKLGGLLGKFSMIKRKKMIFWIVEFD